MSGPERDAEFEAYLARRIPLDPRVREPGPTQPPAELDELVLARARAAIAGTARGRPRWMVPLALAATLVLCLAIVVDLQRTPRTPAQVSAAYMTRDAAGKAREPQDAGAARAAPAATAATPATAAAAAIAAPPPTAATDEAEAKSLERSAKLAPAAPPSSSLASNAPAPGALREEQKRETMAAQPAEARIQMERLQARLPPQIWLQRIQELRAAGNSAEAERQWLAFRKAYPAYAAPAASAPNR